VVATPVEAGAAGAAGVVWGGVAGEGCCRFGVCTSFCSKVAEFKIIPVWDPN
jgi:hypothetical protein